MPDIPQLDDPAADAQLAAYYELLNDLTAQALAGQLREDVFRSEMRRVTEVALLLMFLLAGGDRSMPGAEKALTEQFRTARNSVERLAEDIYDGRYSVRNEEQARAGGPVQTADQGRDKLRNRLALWVFTLAGMDAVGKQHAAPVVIQGEVVEPEYTWELGQTEKHCSTCLEQDGVTRTASGWKALAAIGVQPQGTGLECRGFRCDCRLRRAS